MSSNYGFYTKILKNKKKFAKWINKFKFYPCETDHGGWNEEKGMLYLSDNAIKYLYKDLRKVFIQKANKTLKQMQEQFKKMDRKLTNDYVHFHKKINMEKV